MSRLDLAELKKRVTANMAAHDGAEGEHAVDLGQQHVKIRVDSIDPGRISRERYLMKLSLNNSPNRSRTTPFSSRLLFVEMTVTS